METRHGIGILGIGYHLPEEIRRNDWWPESIVEQWRKRRERHVTHPPSSADEVASDGVRLVLNALQKLADDPFQGARERRVLAKDELPSSMEFAAARQALARASLRPQDIDFMLEYSICPDYLTVPNAYVVHHALGLRRDCFSLTVDATCNSFLAQMVFAMNFVKSSHASYGLLIQSTALSRLLTPEDSQSPWFGDGATAVVLGHVGECKGILAQAHRTDASYHPAVHSTVPGGHWYDDGPVRFRAADPGLARKMLLHVPDHAREIMNVVLAQAELDPSEVDFFACHQASTWFREVCQTYCGLDGARTLDTFGWAGNLGAGNIPLVLAAGERNGLLRNGDLVAAYGGGGGMTWSGLIMRWGC